MQQPRYNAFNLIHKGLRGMLYDAALAIQQTDFASDNAIETVRKVEYLVHAFDEHADHEDAHVLPMVTKYNPQMVADFEKDHVVDHKLSADLINYVNNWKAASDTSARLECGSQLFYAFNEFIAFNLYHMNREEQALLYVLWSHYTDMEIREMQQRIVASIPTNVLLSESRWMIRCANDRELTEWLKGVKMGAPEPFFNALRETTVAELGIERSERIFAAIEEVAVA